MKVTLVYDIDDNNDKLKTLRKIIHNPASNAEINYAIDKLADIGGVEVMIEGDYVELYNRAKKVLDNIRREWRLS